MVDSTKTPLISVLIATYNRANSLRRAIESVLAQPGNFYELVIVNDASPDDTDAVVQPYLADSRVRYYRNEVNLGMRENYIRIFREARGDYIFILTDDDWMVEGGLEYVVQVIQQHPEVGYILSDLPTVDARTGQIFGVDRAYAEDKLLEPSLENMAQLLGLAWVLSRQVIRRDLVDWDAWLKFKQSIFFPVIYSGRAMLKAPTYYIARYIVMHTWFNEVYWHKFGKDELEIGFNLSSDLHQAMRAVLYDYDLTPEVSQIIKRWERKTLVLYLNGEQAGFYDLIRTIGFRRALAKLRSGFNLDNSAYFAIMFSLLQIPFRRIWILAKSQMRQHAPNQFAVLKKIKNRIDGSFKPRFD